MKKIRFAILFLWMSLIFGGNVFAQTANAVENTTVEESSAQPLEKEPITFTHKPILLLKLAPLSIIGTNNTFTFGAEIAPPFGKFSFNFDYGIGSSATNFSQIIRQNFIDYKTTVFRGEIRAYFSDWYYFYALDTKPFGRYWAVEFVNQNVSGTREMAVGQTVTNNYGYFQYKNVPIAENQMGVNLKLGRHIRLKRWFFIDIYGGLGLAKYKVSTTDPTINPADLKFYNIWSTWQNWQPGQKGIVPTLVGGFRLCFPL